MSVGSGHVHCAHGILPVPAPATALLLKGIPSAGGPVEGELCTPTGAALLRYFADDFCTMPVMRTERIGCGMGKKEYSCLNCVRAFLGETEDEGNNICELVCSIDDMTGEAAAFAAERLLEAGALDVYTAPAFMKKGRPAFELTCLCSPDKAEFFASLIFRHTSTLGIRQRDCSRFTLTRTSVTVATKYGDIRVKISEGHGVRRCKAEYDDIAAAAVRYGVSLEEVRREAEM